jgi:hypothetical protein
VSNRRIIAVIEYLKFVSSNIDNANEISALLLSAGSTHFRFTVKMCGLKAANESSAFMNRTRYKNI